jgi:tRNA-modifying protein YgfZ
MRSEHEGCDAMPVDHPVSEGVILFDRSDRARIEVSGPDRARFLHNLTTNEVKRLAPGRGCEAFVTSLQGKTIGYVILLAADDRIIVRADPGGMELALPHLRKYGVFDEVAIEDRSEATFELHLVGDAVDDLVRRAGGHPPDVADYAHVTTELGDRPVRLVRESPTGRDGLTVIGEGADHDDVIRTLRAAGESGQVHLPAAGIYEALSIEAGTPVFGRDVTEKNLPQEFGRDDRAISFVKGCYLGQETVARIDAVGHVNQILKGLSFEPGTPCPAPGSPLEADGKRVGAITSAVDSPWRGHPVALGLIRTGYATPGTVLRVATEGEGPPAVATVRDLPFLPRA